MRQFPLKYVHLRRKKNLDLEKGLEIEITIYMLYFALYISKFSNEYFMYFVRYINLTSDLIYHLNTYPV